MGECVYFGQLNTTQCKKPSEWERHTKRRVLDRLIGCVSSFAIFVFGLIVCASLALYVTVPLTMMGVASFVTEPPAWTIDFRNTVDSLGRNIWFAAIPHNAKEFTIFYDSHKRLHYQERITPLGADDWDKAVKAASSDVRKVVFQSEGGETDAANRMARTINSRNLIFVVDFVKKLEMDCGSACVNVLAEIRPESRRVSPDARIFLHAARLNTIAPSLLIAAAFDVCESLIYSFCQEAATIYLYRHDAYTYEDRTAQAKVANMLEGGTVGRLRRSIETCRPNPFENSAGITLTGRQIAEIINGNEPIACPVKSQPSRWSVFISDAVRYYPRIVPQLLPPSWR